MLTKKELQWLDNRGKFSCWYCPDIPQAMCTMGERPAHCAIMDTDWKEAAEFSERVAAKLAERCVLLEKVVQKALGAAEYVNLSAAAENALKAARLAVEEEMDGLSI